MAFKMKGFPMQNTSALKNHVGIREHNSKNIRSPFDKSPMKQVDPTFGQKIGKNKVDLGKYVLDISSKEGKDFFEKYKNIKTVSSSEPSRVGKTTAQQLNIPEGNKSKIRNILKKTTKLGGKVLGNLVKLAGGSLGLLAQFMLAPVEAGASEAEWQKQNLERQMKWLEEQQEKEEGEEKIIIE
tara:strand:- start:228 stop:776 length:549 start_codon:yes stop_codon:yes gene_type:complete